MEQLGAWTDRRSIRLPRAPDQEHADRQDHGGQPPGEPVPGGTCMDARGLAEAETIDGVKRSTLAELTDWTAQADKVLVF